VNLVSWSAARDTGLDILSGGECGVQALDEPTREGEFGHRDGPVLSEAVRGDE
jgi:hypothetical protein